MLRCRPACPDRAVDSRTPRRHRVLALTLAVGSMLLWPRGVSGVEELYVAEFNNQRINVFARTAAGDVVPLRSLHGPSTGISNPTGIAVDQVHGELYVVNSNTHTITVYSSGADGDVAPLRTLQGAATTLTNPIDVVVDAAHGEIFVADYDQAAGVKVFSRTAEGNTPPLRVISSSNRCTYLALDPFHGELYVAARYHGVVQVYDRAASGNATPLRSIWGSTSGINEPNGLAIDAANDELVVSDNYNSSLRIFARTADGNVAPLRVLQGPLTSLSAPQGIAVDALNGEIVATNYYGGSTAAVLVFARTPSGDVAPLRTLAGPATGLDRSVDVEVIAHAIFEDGFEAGDTASWSGASE